MKKKNINTILGTVIVLSALGNHPAKTSQIIKKQNISKIFKIQDKTDDQSSVSDGSKTEKTEK